MAFNFVLRWIRWAVSRAFAICIFNDAVRREIRASARCWAHSSTLRAMALPPSNWYWPRHTNVPHATAAHTKDKSICVLSEAERTERTNKNEEMVCCIGGITAEISFDSSTALSRILSFHSRIHSLSLPLKNGETVGKRNIQAIRTYAPRAKVILPTIRAHDSTSSAHTHTSTGWGKRTSHIYGTLALM